MNVEQLLEAVRLKALDRTGWVRRGIAGPESVAAHSWGVAWLVLALLPEDLDRQRALTYAVLHDLPEVRVGDLTPHDPMPRSEKVRREREAMQGLTGSSPRGRSLAALWDAYEALDDDEARFVRQLDRLDMALQAVAYAEAQPTHREALVEFVESAAKVVEHPVLRPLIDALEARIR
ncbi:MAG: HD domain-containing protein [Myxococcota bacterium]